jgi:single-strand DNA-binding protein
MVATVRGAAHERKVMDVASDNQIIIVGNLTDDPELRYTPNGAAVVKFRVAVNRRYRDEAGTWKDGDTSYFTVNAWRTLAENIAESLTRGTRVIVAGRLQMRSWETQEGDKRTVVEIEADEVGPSLRWATAKVERQGRSGDWSAPAPVGAPLTEEETPLDAD